MLDVSPPRRTAAPWADLSGLPFHACAPAIDEWIHGLVDDDATLREYGCTILREVASMGSSQTYEAATATGAGAATLSVSRLPGCLGRGTCHACVCVCQGQVQMS
jgi:siderophore synthetase component